MKRFKYILYLYLFLGASTCFAGTIKQADFNGGSNQYLTANDSASLSITGNQTIEFWGKPTSLGSRMSFYSRYPTGKAYYLDILTTGLLDTNFCADAGCATQTEYKTQQSIDTNWHHYAIVDIMATPEIKIYIDGTATGTTMIDNSATSINDPTGILAIGERNDGVNFPFTGSIYDFRIYPSARSATDIAADYSCNLTAQTGLNAHWASPTNFLTDLTANGNDLTNINTVTFQDVTFNDCAGGGGTPAAATTGTSTPQQNYEELLSTSYILLLFLFPAYLVYKLISK